MRKLKKYKIVLIFFVILIIVIRVVYSDDIKSFIGKFKTIKSGQKSNEWNKENRTVEMMRSDSQVKEYLTFNEMKNDSSLKAGDVCKTLGYNETGDGGIAYWKIKNSDNLDNLVSFNLKNSLLMAEYILENNIQINVKAIGIISDDYSEEVKNRNSEILKKLILKYKKDMCFYFPIGQYYFNQIDIDDDGYYEIKIYGENGGDEKSSYKSSGNVIINTPDAGFINRTTKSGNNETKFIVSNIRYIGASFYDKKPIGICFGVTKNLGCEYNFKFNNVYFSGYEYGFYSPGYSCGTSGNNIAFSHCKYGIYIEGATHGLYLQGVDLLYCKYGIRLGVGGNNATIKGVHAAVGCFEGMNDYLKNESSKIYGIHSKGGLIIDGVYYEQYSGQLDVSNYTLIDYEGWGNGGVGKLIIENATIGNMGAGNKGYFFTGSTYVGPGPETRENNITELFAEARNNYFPNGCVEFNNCIVNEGIDITKNKIKNCFNISGGLDKAFGYTFDNLELFGEGLAFTQNYKRKFSSNLISDNYSNNDILNRYSTLNIPEDNRIWSEIEFPISPIYDNAGNSKGTRYKGSITINKIQNNNINVTIGIIGVVNGKLEMVRELVDLTKEDTNKILKIYIDEYISKEEAGQTFFGYRCNGTGESNEKITKEDEERINYDIEIIYDSNK